MSQADRSPTPDQRHLCWAVAGFLLLAVAAVYGQTLFFRFLNYDDNVFVYESGPVRSGLNAKSIAWAFTNGPMGEWYPLSVMSHMLDAQLFGPGAWGHHLTSVLLHAATSIGLFLVLRSMTGELWPSAFASAVFAVHPQHVESVAWIAERRDVLSGFFFVLTLAAYLRYVRRGRTLGRYLLVALMLSLGLMSKSMLVTVPPLLLLLDYWPLGRFGRAADLPEIVPALPRQPLMWLVVEKLPLLALSLADSVVTIRTHLGDADSENLTWPTRLANAPVALVTYLVQFFCPIDLAAFYPFPSSGHPAWKIGGALTLLAGLSGAAIVWRQRAPYLPVGWFWFFGMLTPVLGVVTVASHAMADRYMYLPGIGLAIALAWSAARLGARLAMGRWLLWVGAAVIIAVLTAGAVRQTSYWRGELGLWEHSLAVTEDNFKAEYGLAMALAQSKRPEEAIQHYRLALKHDSTNLRALNNLGSLLLGKGQVNAALLEYRRALTISENVALTHSNLGAALADKGQFDEAQQHYLRAIELDPRFPPPHVGLAVLFANQNKYAEAIEELREALRLNPNQPEVHRSLDALLRQLAPNE